MNHLMTQRRLSLAARTATAIVSAIALAACGTASSPDPASPPSSSRPADADLLAAHGLAGLDAPQIIERLDTMPVADRPADLLASVQPDALVLTDEKRGETRLPMPEDEVYVSVAPYRERTHECHFHSLTTCLGELAGAEVRLVLTADDGEVLLDEQRRTYENGFVGIWVPRDTEATLTVEHEGRRGTAAISTTDAEDPTCVTTLQLT